MATPPQRTPVTFRSAGVCCAGWHYAGRNGACVIMAGGMGVPKEPATDRFAARFHRLGYSVLAFDYRRVGESAGQPRHLVRVRDQLQDWSAAIEFARHLPEVDSTQLVIWGFSLSGGHVFRVAAKHPDIAGAIAVAPTVDGWAASSHATRHTTAGAQVRLTWAIARDVARSVLGREPVLIPLAGSPGTLAMLSTPDALRGAQALDPAGQYDRWKQLVSARSAIGVSLYRPGRAARLVKCPLLVLTFAQDQSALARPAQQASNRAPRAELVRLPGDHYAAFADSHEQALSAQVEFLGRHTLVDVRRSH